MGENEIAKIVVNTACRIHKELGPGFFLNMFMKQCWIMKSGMSMGL